MRTKVKIPKVINLLLATLVSSMGWSLEASELERYYALYRRLNGVSPSKVNLDEGAALMKAGKDLEAGRLATDINASPYFYTLVVKDWAKQFQSLEGSISVDLKDLSATIVGMTRDGVPFDQILYEDILYTGIQDAAGTSFPREFNVDNLDRTDGANHYVSLERVPNFASPSVLVADTQSNRFTRRDADGNIDTGRLFSTEQAAGALTTQAYHEEFLLDGTNRRWVQAWTKHFMCRTVEELNDVTLPDLFVGPDVTRSPSNDSRVYLNSCRGCHAYMDPLRNAVSNLDWSPNGEFDTRQDQSSHGKVRNGNAVAYEPGYRAMDNTWHNLLPDSKSGSYLGFTNGVDGQNYRSGKGVKSLGKVLATSRAFPSCMAKKVFKKVCNREIRTDFERDQLDTIANYFSEQDNFNLRNLFIRTTLLCLESGERTL